MSNLAGRLCSIEPDPEFARDWWRMLLRRLAQDYCARAVLFFHEFGSVQKGTFFEAVGVTHDYIKKYAELSHHNPWNQFLRRDTGFFIWGGDVNPIERAMNDPALKPFLIGWQIPQNAIRGIGAVLCKDNEKGLPQWGVAIALLRPDGEPGIGHYSEEEREQFQRLIWPMVRQIRKHPFVARRISQDERENRNHDGQATNGVLVPPQETSSTRAFLDKLPIKDGHRAAVARVIDAAERDDEALLDKVRRTLDTHEAGQGAEIIAAEGQIPLVPPPPKPGDLPLYDNTRPRNLQTGRLEGVDTFFPRVYGPWIVPDPEGGSRPVLMLPRKLIEELDPDCDRALAAWPNNHKGQEFPIKIARKGSATPPTPPLTGQIQEVWRSTSRVESYKQRRAKQAGNVPDR